MRADPLFARSDLLRMFAQVEVYLLLGGAIGCLGVLAAAFLVLRRRVEPLLLWFSVFAGVYGLHLILDYQLLWWLGLRPELFRRVVIGFELLMPLPAVFFFESLGVLGRYGRWLVLAVSSGAVGLAAASLVIGPEFRVANHVFVIVALVVFVLAFRESGAATTDGQMLRWGLMVFIGCALYDHVTGLVGRGYHNVEPYGFVVLIGVLGVIAGRRTLAREKELGTIQQELEIARRIQRSILPAAVPHATPFRVAARYVPMTAVAGDFYDFLVPDEEHAGILVADVSGHGVPAALIASMVKLAAASQTENVSQPAELLRGMNAALCGNTQSQFVTAAYVYLDARAGELRYAAAAHPPMLLLRGEEVSAVVENGLMLGAFPFAEYTTATQPLLAGDRLLLYTDGIVEAADAAGEEFGEERVCALLRETRGLDEEGTADRIVERVRGWSAAQNDDWTVVVCDVSAGLAGSRRGAGG